MIYEAVIIFFGVVAGLAILYAAAVKLLTDQDDEEYRELLEQTPS